MVKRSFVTPESVLLVSGGARGITALCVIRLAEKTHCRFILLGRSEVTPKEPAYALNCQDEAELKKRIMVDLQTRGEKPTPQKVQKEFREIQTRREIQDTLQMVTQAGGMAEYVSVDITDSKALMEKIAEPVRRLGAISGIIHGAGSLADKLIERKSEADFETVYNPKIVGLENMLNVLPISQLKFLVLFSSIVGFFGNVGQADYAIANEILNKTAFSLKRKNPDCHIVSINWGPWDAGMVTPELKRAFEERNVQVIPTHMGVDLFVKELTSLQQNNIQVVVGNPPARPFVEILAELQHYQIRRRLSLEANPFLNDHTIGQNPVLPATCAATWIANACEQLYPSHTFYSIANFRVLKGIVFDETLAESYVLDLIEKEKTSDGRIVFDALIWSQNAQNRKILHYKLILTLMRVMPRTPQIDLDLKNITNVSIPGKQLYEDGTLFHGATFQGVNQVLHMSPGKLVMECILPKLDPAWTGQFPVQTSNPYIYDAVVQCLLIWAQTYYQAPCLPASLIKLEQFKAIPFEKPFLVFMEIKSHRETSVVADITVTDMNGEVYVQITSLEGTISLHLKRIIGASTK